MFNNIVRIKTNFKPAKIIIACLILLTILSLSSIYSSLHQAGELKEQEIFYKEVMWVAISWVILILFFLLNYRVYFDLAYVLYAINIFLLIAVDLFGRSALGAQRWLNIGGFNFQPSELSKIITIFFLARVFSSQTNKGFLKGALFPFSLLMINVLLIIKQPDLGTAMVLVLLFFLMGFASRNKKRYFIAIIIAAIMLSPLAWNHLKDYQKKRLIVFLNPNAEPLGAGYTIIQSKIAIGSGKIFGKGFLSGTQNQFNFLPERHTDFIFTVIAEEWGFAGAMVLLLIYLLIINNILLVARYQKDNFAQLILVGMACLFFLHVFINIGMTLGILPVVGIPLLFVSYGGTHLLVSFMLLGIFLNIYRQ
ncbi:MAG: rod shape-determining protein RodA [Candidatus Omnitrophica bacterium]|jgi:rod shape determining protein RodA|nr:rod shape-determining protein RodA [Candidatus Omnitrophota bacterium]